VGPRAGLDAVSKRKIPSPHRSADHPALNQSLYGLNYPGSPFRSKSLIKLPWLSFEVDAEVVLLCYELCDFAWN